MQQINWYLSAFDNHKLMGNKKQIGNNGKPCQRNYRLAFWLGKEVVLCFSLLPMLTTEKWPPLWVCPMYLTSSAGVQYRIPIFLCHLSRGNVIKWTSYPPICQSLRRKQVSSSERGLTLIFHNPQYYKRGETKCYLKGFVLCLRGMVISVWTLTKF